MSPGRAAILVSRARLSISGSMLTSMTASVSSLIVGHSFLRLDRSCQFSPGTNGNTPRLDERKVCASEFGIR
jgi:hypothetical protein